MEEDNSYLKLSTEDKCQHKSWKARSKGYEEATELFNDIDDEKSAEFNKYLGLLKKFAVDSNAVAQEKGLSAILAFVTKAACASKTVGDIMNALINKCFSSPRTRTKELAVEITLMYIEIEKQDVVCDELMKGLENKSPKVVSTCIGALREALCLFGSQVISVKPIVKFPITKLLEDRDKTVRDESKQLCVEIYRWIGSVLKTQLSLKPVALSELEKEFERIPTGTAVPKRYLKSQKPKHAISECQDEEGNVNDIVKDSAPEINAYDLMPEVDILSKLPKNFYEQCEDKKWLERKSALDILLQLSTDVKLQPGDYGDLVRTLKRCITKDSNVVVVSVAVKCVTNIILGLRQKFQPYTAAYIPVLFDKFKEKKQNVVLALRECIDAVYSISSFEVMLEDIQAALVNKNPQVKAETCAFLSRAFSTCTTIQLNKKLLKSLIPSLIKTLNDTDLMVRDNSAEAIGTALKVVGDSLMSLLKDVDQIKMSKIKDFSDKATVKQHIVTEKKPVPVKIEIPSKSDSATFKKPTSSGPGKTKAPSSARAVRPSTAKKGIPVVEVTEFKEQELSDDDVLSQALEILSQDIITNLGSSNWKERLAATEKVLETMNTLPKEKLPAQSLIRLITKKPGFKENNPQCLKLRFEILTFIATNAQISRTAVESCLSDVVDKIGDAKVGSFVASALSSLAEATSLEYMSVEVLNLAFNQRNPKNQADALTWVSSAIKEFGFQIQLKDIIDSLKKGFSSTNPTVRNSALSLLGTMFMYTGEALRAYFDDEKPSMLQLIDSELEKMKGVKPPVPIRGKSVKAPGTSAVTPDSNEYIDLRDLIPQVDISGQISQQILSDLSDKDWHLRSDALQKISTIVTDAKYILPNLGDLPIALKPRLVDTNKKIALQALQICQLLGSSMGSHCSKQLRNFAPGILACFGDSKVNMRVFAVQCLNTWVENCSVANLFEAEMIFDALKSDNPFLRIELFSWLTEKLPTVSSLPAQELISCLPILFTCLEDRNPDVRKKASECLLPFMIHVGFESMARATSKLKPASKTTTMVQLDKVRQNLPSKPAAKPKVLAKSVTLSDKTSLAPPSNDDGNKSKMVRSTSKPKLALKAPTVVSKSKKEEEIDTSPALVVNKLKDMRMVEERALKVLKWNFTNPREEFYTQLKDQMIAANWSKTLITYCFHNDFKFHIKAIDILAESSKSSIDATKANLDLILKWLALRFFDTNPSVLIKSLEYLRTLFQELNKTDYRLLDSDVASFVPYLILKIGDAKDAVRKTVREIIKLITRMYPYSKMFTYVMQGLASKNGRQRAECLEELDSMIETYGINVCQPSPPAALKEIARHIADRDNSVRNAALNCCARAKIPGGEKVWDYFGTLSDKDRSLLEERIKRICKNMQPKAVDNTIQSVKMSPSSHVTISNTSEEESYRNINEQKVVKTPVQPYKCGTFKLETDDIDKIFHNKEPFHVSGLIEVNADDILNLPDIKLPKTRMRPPPSSLKILNNSEDAETAVNLVMAQLAAQDIPLVIQAFAQIDEVLKNEDQAFKVFESRVDQLLVMGAMQYRYAHNKHMSDENICKANVLDLYKCVTTSLISIFDNPLLSKKASRDVLRDLIPHLLTVILDDRLNDLQEGSTIIKYINVLIMRVLQKANTTHVLSALIKLLHDCVGSVNVSDRFAELVMKCLWKVIRLCDTVIDDVNVDRTLLDIHIFLKAYPSTSWKKRPNDTPLRTIKTLLHKLVEVKNEDIMKHFSLITDRDESELIYLLNKLLAKQKVDNHKSRKSAEFEDNVGENNRRKRTKSSPLKLSKSTHEALTEIFKKIGSKEQTKEGISELHEFTQTHPEADIEPYLKTSSDFFRNYIRQGMQRLEKEKESSNSNCNSPIVMSKKSEETKIWNSNFSGKGFSYTRGISSQAWEEPFPPVPPCTVDTTPMDYVEWLKSVVARLGMDTSKYDDPDFVEKITGNGNDGPLTDDEISKMFTDVERYKKIIEELKHAA